MRFSERWLRACVETTLSSDELAHALTMAGLEVEERVTAAPEFSGVVVARVLDVQRHPDADRLSVCQVDVGEASPVQIVCGAPNVAAGVVVPCARPGAILPGGMNIGVAKMRGVRSEGMLCSSRELGLSEDHAGLMLLQSDLVPGQSLREALDLDDTIWLLKLTPNLAHCMSVTGVAREVAAITGARLNLPELPRVSATIPDRLSVQIDEPTLCGRFSGRIIRGVNARAATPDWIRRRLERSGQRSISALVDLSNYVMLELGRPTHVFDLAKIHGGLQVRWGRAGETLKLLNGQTIELGPQADDLPVGVISDDLRVESLAGIMGGDATAVSLDTTDIYVEAAFWWPHALIGRARRYNFSTDAAQRFERGVDAATTAEHLDYLCALILQVCGGQAGPIDDQVLALPAREPVRMRLSRAVRVIGMPLSEADCANAFTRLGLSFTREQDGSDTVFSVVPESRRFDLNIEEDLIEEVVRMVGVEKLPSRAPRMAATLGSVPGHRQTAMHLKRRLAARDWQEVIHFSFVDSSLDEKFRTDHTAIRLRNPIAENLDVMRTSLWPGLIGSLRHNLNRKLSRVRLFEIGRVFHRDPEAPAGPLEVAGIRQPLKLGGLACGSAWPEQWGETAREVDFFDLKADLEYLHPGLVFQAALHPALHPGQSARISSGQGRSLGWLGSLHPALVRELDLTQTPILFELLLDPLLEARVVQVVPVTRFPILVRDLAFVLEASVPAASVLAEIDALRKTDSRMTPVNQVLLFDEYRGKGLENKDKSLAFRFWLQDTERTLSDAQADAAMAAITERLALTHGARLRSA
jgi:phenylalanyl-tRNA synthetase beta chain